MRALLLALLLACLPSIAAADEVGPDQLVRTLLNDVLAVVKQERHIPPEQSKKLAEVVQTRVIPHFDFRRMTRTAMAVNWRRATPDQQQSLVDEFRTLLTRTYSAALSLYRDQAVDFKPLRSRGDEKEVTVRSEVRGSGPQPVTVDYVLEKTAGGWKIFDVKVAGVSLVSTYRDEFASYVREGGIDGLIKLLGSRNRRLEAKTKS
jgi:phospholipid transport system substrate-binding protein